MSQAAVSFDCESTDPSIKSTDKHRKSKGSDKDSSKRLRSACDACHAAKIRCAGGIPCARCARDNLECHYSCKAKIGKPRGSMNKKTIERLRQSKEARDKQQVAPHTPPPTSDGNTQNITTTTTISPLLSCDDDSAFSSLQSPNERQTLGSQSPTGFNLDSFSFQESIVPESGLDCMEDWLPNIPDDPVENDGFQLSNGLNDIHNEKEIPAARSERISNTADFSYEKDRWPNAPATETELPFLFPYCPSH